MDVEEQEKHANSTVQQLMSEKTVTGIDTKPQSAVVVDFEGDDDPENPQNWSSRRKWLTVCLMCMMSLIINLAMLMIAPAASQITEDFRSTNPIDTTWVVTIWEAGEVISPLVAAPLSEAFGRLPVYHVANSLFIAFFCGSAASKSIGMLLAFRFVTGIVIVSTTLNACIAGDMFKTHERGSVIAIMGMAPLIGPLLGPIVGGYISQALGWRWIFWIVAIIVAALQITFVLTFRETYKVQILKQKARKLRRLTGNPNIRSKYEVGEQQQQQQGFKSWLTYSLRPIRIFVMCPAVVLVSIAVALATSYGYTLFTSIGIIYQKNYQFSQGESGLAYLGLGVGMVISLFTWMNFLDRYLKRKTAQGKNSPECRLPPMMVGAVIIPIGMATFGWTAQAHAFWFVPIIFEAFVGFGYVAVSISTQSYIVDAFGIYSASALAATISVRNLVSAFLPIAAPALQQRIDWGWTLTVFALIGITLMPPVPLSLLKWGEKLRRKHVLKVLE